MEDRSRSMYFGVLAASAILALTVFALLTLSSGDRGEDDHTAPAVAEEGTSAPEGRAPVGLGPSPPIGSAMPSAEAPAPPAGGVLAVAGTDERRVVPMGLHGRVVTPDGVGVEGVDLVIRFAGANRATARTGADGVFAFTASAMTERGSLEARKHGWRFHPRRLRLAEGTVPEFVAEQLDLAPFRARLVDARTHEPVPRMRVRLRGKPDIDVVVESDDEGIVDPDIEIAVGSPTVRPLEGRPVTTAIPDHRADTGNQVVDIPVEIGPTYHFELDLPTGTDPADLEALLVPASHPAAARMARARECGALLAFGEHPSWLDREEDSLLAEVRSDGPRDGRAWARFAECPPENRLPTDLVGGYELLVADARVFGRAEVPNVTGICPSLVNVMLSPGGWIRGHVRLPGAKTGAAENRRGIARVLARSFAEALAPLPRVTLRDAAGALVHETFADSHAEFGFLGLAPGEYSVTVESVQAGTASRPVTVVAGETAEVEIVLPRDPATAFAAGTLRSRSGSYEGDVRLALVSHVDPELRFQQWVQVRPVLEFGADGGAPRLRETATPFSFQGVPPGAYELTVRSADGLRWSPERVVIREANTSIELTCENDAGTAELTFAFHDAATGESVRGEGVVWVDGIEPLLGARVEEVERVARPSDGRWVAFAPGYAPALGRWSVGEDDASLHIDAAMARGVAVVVQATTPWGDPLAGVEILFDGKLAGQTDGAGLLVVQGFPGRATEARLAGWIMASNPDWLDDTGSRGVATIVLVRR